MLRRKVNVLFQNLEFIATVFVQPDFANAEDVWAIEELWDDRKDIVRQFNIFRFFGIDAEPTKMLESKFRGPSWFVFGQLRKIVAESIDRTAVEASPES